MKSLGCFAAWNMLSWQGKIVFFSIVVQMFKIRKIHAPPFIFHLRGEIIAPCEKHFM